MKLDGKVALVTGSGRGIGKALATRLSAEGASVMITDIAGDSAEEAAAEIEKEGGKAAAVTIDVTDRASIQSAIDEVARVFGRLDILVNNAGIRLVNPFLEQDEAGWRATLDINLTGVFLTSQVAIPKMLESGKGKIVNIASATGILALTDRSAYAASKAGVIGLTKAMAYELSRKGIWVNAIAPGPIETPLTAPYYKDEAMVALLRREIPRGLWGQPEELGGAVVFLSSSDSDYVCGAVLAVDGGWITGKAY